MIIQSFIFIKNHTQLHSIYINNNRLLTNLEIVINYIKISHFHTTFMEKISKISKITKISISIFFFIIIIILSHFY
jgi:hypothetical protein